MLPDAQVMDFKEGNPALSQGLDNATSILSLICLVAMVLGAIGVAMAMHAHLEQRMDMLAILKAVGARSSDLLRIFLLQTMALGLLGGLIGVDGRCAGDGGASGGLREVCCRCIRCLHFPWSAVGAGFGTGLLTTLLFCLPPLLGCARGEADSGAAQAGGTGTDYGTGVVCTLVGAPAAGGDRGAWWLWRWARLRGRFRIQ